MAQATTELGMANTKAATKIIAIAFFNIFFILFLLFLCNQPNNRSIFDKKRIYKKELKNF